MKRQVIVSLCVVATLLGAAGLAGAVPQSRPLLLAGAPSVVSYQGQVNLGGSPFNGKGYFKFAIVDPTGPETFWSNDGSSAEGAEPEMAVQLTVTNGLFNVLLGDTSLTNMTEPLDAAVFADPECYLRVWFSADGGTFQQLSPDRRIAAVPYALQAERASFADYADEAGDAARLDGYLPGSTSGRIPVNNGVLNTNLDADMLDGQHANDLEVPGGAIVLGFQDDPRLTGAGYVDLGPRVDMWRSTDPTFAPLARSVHTAVWTGTEMIVWGGYGLAGSLHSGGRYDPATGFWMPTTTTDAPSGRVYHTAVWTGSEMIVWGGRDPDPSVYFNTGGRYNPATNTWANTTTTGAPSARSDHSAVWTGTSMIVWGGYDGTQDVNSGRRYSPLVDSWMVVSTTGAPAARSNHTAVWTGSEMIVWGGYAFGTGYLNSGGRYDPATNTWTDISTVDAPSGRQDHSAVWTGSEMIVWGGDDGDYLNSGGRYNPATDTWTYITTSGAPEGRSYHTAVWTGSQMIVWGGNDGPHRVNTGARYDPGTDSWTDTTTNNAPPGRHAHTAVWTGSEMIVWGGSRYTYLYSGGRYSLLHLYQKP